MTSTITTKCDGCGTQLDDAGSMPTYGMELKPFRVPTTSHTLYAVAVQPPITESHHFCSIRCLQTWATKLGGA